MENTEIRHMPLDFSDDLTPITKKLDLLIDAINRLTDALHESVSAASSQREGHGA